MDESEGIVLDAIDEKAAQAFPGLTVRKDLLRRVRSAYSVPMFVIEFLLGKYCASTDPQVIEEGLEYVRGILRDKYVKPDEREMVKAKIKERTTYEIIDKVKVRLVETQDKYWAELANINLDFVNIEDSQIRKHERLLQGGHAGEVLLNLRTLVVVDLSRRQEGDVGWYRLGRRITEGCPEPLELPGERRRNHDGHADQLHGGVYHRLLGRNPTRS